MGKNAKRRRNMKLYRKAARRVEQGAQVGRMFSLGDSYAKSQFIERRRQAGVELPNRAVRRQYVAKSYTRKAR